MGSGIAQVASQAGNEVVITDTRADALDLSKEKLAKIMNRLVEKGRLTDDEANSIQGRISYTTNLNDLSESDLVIEAIIENLDVKKDVFSQFCVDGLIIEDQVGSGPKPF